MYVPEWVLGTSKFIIYIILVFIITLVTILVGLRSVVQDNWEKYRCNPLIIPFAGLFGHDASQTFTECLTRNVNDTAEPVVKPYDDLFSILKNTAGNMGDSLNDIKGVMSNMKDNLVDNINGVLTKLGNMGATAQFMMMKIQVIFEKLLALYVTLLYFAWSMVKGLESMIRDPGVTKTQEILDKTIDIIANPPKPGDIGKAINKAGKAVGKSAKKTGKKMKKAFCFISDTCVLMNNGSTKEISKIEIGDSLYGDNVVEGTMKFSGKDAKMVDNNGIVSTASHHVRDNGCFIRAEYLSTAIEEPRSYQYLYDLDTSNHRIVCVNNKGECVTYTDFTEIDDVNDTIETYELGLLNGR